MKVSGCERILLLLGFLGAVLASGNVLANDEAAETPRNTAPTKSWILRLPEESAVSFHGLGNFDEAGVGQGQFLYPAPNAVGLFAAIFTHALMVNSARRNQINKMQKEADKVLNPYRHVLDKLDSRELMAGALAVTSNAASGKLVDSPAGSETETIVESIPRFVMTPDQSVIMLENMVAIQKPGVSLESAYRNTIRVVLPASGAADPIAFWTANDGERLKEASTRLLAESIDIAFMDVDSAQNDDKPYRTIRYPEGAAEKIERAQVIEDRCGRLLIRTLRGTLMSVPAAKVVSPVATEAHCGPIATFEKQALQSRAIQIAQ